MNRFARTLVLVLAAAAGLSAAGPAPSLVDAVKRGDREAVSALLRAKADVNKPAPDGTTALHYAVEADALDLVTQLVRAGANVKAANRYGIAPITLAATNGSVKVLEALLEAGADPDARIKVHPWYMVYTGCGNGNCGLTNTVGSTAFWRAAYGTDVDAMKLLVKYGADPNIPTMAPPARGGGAGGRGGGAAFGRGGGPPGQTPPGGGPDAAPPPRTDPSGLPPVPAGGPGVFAIHAAAGVEYGEGFAGNAHRYAPTGMLAAVKYLVEEVGLDVNSVDDDGNTAVHHAASRGDTDMIRYLVSKGADVKAVNREGQTTIDLANGPVQRVQPWPDTIKYLESLGAKNNHKCLSC